MRVGVRKRLFFNCLFFFDGDHNPKRHYPKCWNCKRLKSVNSKTPNSQSQKILNVEILKIVVSTGKRLCKRTREPNAGEEIGAFWLFTG
jgi:hypothetical protein